MESGKRMLSIEDYSLSGATLEEIFLHFTKSQRESS